MKPIAPPVDVHRVFDRPSIRANSPISAPMRRVDAGGGVA